MLSDVCAEVIAALVPLRNRLREATDQYEQDVFGHSVEQIDQTVRAAAHLSQALEVLRALQHDLELGVRRH